MGYKMVETLSVSVVTAIMEGFELTHAKPDQPHKIPGGILGVPPQPIRMRIKEL